MEKTIKKIEDYKIVMDEQHFLGKGTFGIVYRGLNEKTNQQVAVKIISKSLIDPNLYNVFSLVNEIKIMRRVTSENIVMLYDIVQTKNNYYLIQELCYNGSLESKIQDMIKKGKRFSEKEAKQMLYQMTNGFLVLVKHGIIHRDLKPANVMIKGNKLKIGDFGYAKQCFSHNSRSHQSWVGTPLYMPIQMLKLKSYSSKCDVWALATIYYQLLHLKTPWSGQNKNNLTENILQERLEIDESVSEVSRNFLEKCLQISQEKRLCWDEVFLHPIFENRFKNFANSNNEFEDKFKAVINELRFEIQTKKIDLTKVLHSLGFNENKKELNIEEFHQLIKTIHPGISKEQTSYILKNASLNFNGFVSLHEFVEFMNLHNINLTINPKKRQNLCTNLENQRNLNESIDKANYYFRSLHYYMQRENVSLYQIFTKYSHQKQEIDKDEFQRFMNDLNSGLTDRAISYVFDSINKSRNKTLSFQDFNAYFQNVNKSSSLRFPSPQEYKGQNHTKNYFQPEIHAYVTPSNHILNRISHYKSQRGEIQKSNKKSRKKSQKKNGRFDH